MSAEDHSDLEYFGVRDGLATDLRAGLVAPDPQSLVNRVRDITRLDPATCSEWVERFRNDLARHVEMRNR